MHDLTNCLRIGDVTVFGNDGTSETLEIKTDPGRRSPTQTRRIRAAQEAVRNGGPLPGTDPMARLHDLDVQFTTHLDLLRTATERASRDGIFTVKVPGARTLVVTDIYGCDAQGWTGSDFAEQLGRKMTPFRCAQGSPPTPNTTSALPASTPSPRDPQRVPFAAYHCGCLRPADRRLAVCTSKRPGQL